MTGTPKSPRLRLAWSAPPQRWPELMIELADAIDCLGPIRADFTREAGLMLDGRAATPGQVIAAAAAHRERIKVANDRPLGGVMRGDL